MDDYMAGTRSIRECPPDRLRWCENAAGLARTHGVTRQAVVQWQRHGCPSYITEDGGRLYDGGAVFWWRMWRETGKTKDQVLADDARRAAARRAGHCTCGVATHARR